MKKSANLDEETVAGLWTKRTGSFYSWQGKQIELIYPGRRSKSGGCDFEDAVFRLDGQRITGNVEVHVRTSGWFAHRHHLDPRYSGVALHVVLEDDNRLQTVACSGRLVPTIALGTGVKATAAKLNSKTYSCCGTSGALNNRIFVVIYEAAAARFASKIEKFRGLFAIEDTGQVLYQSLARALGYSSNCSPFEELAWALPLDRLQYGMAAGDKNLLKALLVGTAGLLPSQRSGPGKSDQESESLEKTWAEIKTTDNKVCCLWINNGVRPQNRPIRRLMALAELLWRFRSGGLEARMMDLVREAPEIKYEGWLGEQLAVRGDKYWDCHLDFGMPLPRPAALLGKARVSDIIINILLPFACARFPDNSNGKEAERIYFSYPAASCNQITGYMAGLLGLEGKLNRAAELQGLLHLFYSFCRQKLCDACPVSMLRS